MNEIIISGISKTIKGTEILKNIDLKLRGGKIYGLYGSNGSGKTMLLRAVAGLIRIDSGSIIINGKQLHKETDFHESIGVVIENPQFWDGYTGFENLKMLASIKKQINDEAIRATLEKVGLDPGDKKTVKKYSLGMKQRLGLASALIGQPPILILDEPTNGLDPVGIHEIRTLIRSLPEKYNCTVFVSSHLLSEVELMADTVGILNHGRLLFEGTLEQLRSGAAAQGYPTDNLEDTFLALIDADNRQRGAAK